MDEIMCALFRIEKKKEIVEMVEVPSMYEDEEYSWLLGSIDTALMIARGEVPGTEY